MVKGAWRVVDALPVGVDLARLRREHGEAAKAFLENL
jgi:8-oxoguanine deaminase